MAAKHIRKAEILVRDGLFYVLNSSRLLLQCYLMTVYQLRSLLRVEQIERIVINDKPEMVKNSIQKFPNWPPGARTANGTALCHWVQWYHYFV